MRRQSGVSLIEALVALVIMSFGMLALVGLQATMRQNTDVAKQRSEAVRIAQAEIEYWRSFSVLDTTPQRIAYADLSSTLDPQEIAGYTTNTSYQLLRTVASDADSPFKRLNVRVTWADRTGALQQVELNTVLAGLDPALSGALSKKPNGSPERRPRGRHLSIPLQAKDMGNGSSALKPDPTGRVVWLFNNVSGLITRLCTVANAAVTTAGLSNDQIVNCSDAAAHLLSGVVRFANGPAITAAQAENPNATALNLDVQITLTSSGHPDPGYQCFDDAPTSSAAAASTTIVTYYCAIFANSNGTWSGRSYLVPRAFSDVSSAWAISDSAEAYGRVCRYTTLAGDDGANLEHPLNYTQVALNTALPHQNFLVIPGSRNCPTDNAADPLHGDYVNSNTRLHQPR